MFEVRRKARIEIARLLLEDWLSFARKAKQGASFPQQRSVTGLASAIKLLRRDDTASHARLVGAVRRRRLRGLAEREQAELDAALGAVVARIPFALVAPDHVLRAGDWYDLSLDDPRELAEETADHLDLILDEAHMAESGPTAEVDGDLADDDENDGSWTDGRRAVQLSPESSGASSRFAGLGIDAGVATFAENGPSDGLGFGNRAYQPWRTRARRRRPRAITDPDQAANLLARESGCQVTELRALEVRGRPPVSQRPVRRQLAVAVHRLRSANKVAAGTLAQVLECDPATIWRLAKSGQEINARSQRPIGEEKRLDAAA
jgi:hypothetical protein